MGVEASPDSGAVASDRARLLALSVGCLGVVFGDIGTSPLYAIKECFNGAYAIQLSDGNVLGVISLVFWTLALVVSLKYITYIMRADNNGEGGVLALTALISHKIGNGGQLRLALVAMGLFGASLLYGDGVITPAISVLSAVEGLQHIAPATKAWIVPITVAILAGLFAMQSRGTSRVGALFGPIILVWFFTIGVLGAVSIFHEPRILAALNPLQGLSFLVRNSLHGFLVLGAVCLCVTGAEALYADMGHFGPRPIRISWLGAAWPCLLLNYFGQGALILRSPDDAQHPFYNLAPGWAQVPLVFLATVATVIASQAVISGAFSLTRQALQLGFMPRMQIVHTSSMEIGQVYVPAVNWMLMIATIALVIGFKTSSGLAAAYGVAVTTTMLATSILFFVVCRERWHWPRWKAASLVGIFMVVDVALFSANCTKIAHGAWFPLAMAFAIYTVLQVWRRGRQLVMERLGQGAIGAISDKDVMEHIRSMQPVRVPGKAIFMTGHPRGVPPAFLHNLQHNKVMHSEVGFLTIQSVEVPRVPAHERIAVISLGDSVYRIVARYGFAETARIHEVIDLAREKGLDFDISDTVFFLGREMVIPKAGPGMPLWQERLFAMLSRNALGATDFYGIPADRVVVLGAQLEI